MAKSAKDLTNADSVRLAAADGHRFAAYRSRPKEGNPRGGLVVIQEIFGVNRHIRNVTDTYAAEGYLCLAPGLFWSVHCPPPGLWCWQDRPTARRTC